MQRILPAPRRAGDRLPVGNRTCPGSGFCRYSGGVAGACSSPGRVFVAHRAGNLRGLRSALLKIKGFESDGIHLRGSSSVGKTTSSLLVAASVWGGGIRSWRTTDNGLEGIAQEHCVRLLCLENSDRLCRTHSGRRHTCSPTGIARRAQQRMDRQDVPLLGCSCSFRPGRSLSRTITARARASRASRLARSIRVADFPADAGAGLGGSSSACLRTL